MDSIPYFASTINVFHVGIQRRLGLFIKSEGLEQRLIDLICCSMFALGVFFLILLSFLKACYGRYQRSPLWLGFEINARLAWFLQEIPSFGIPMAFILTDYKINGIPYFTKAALGGLFVFHYWQRSCVYPFLIKGGKPTPLLIWFLAFVFCTANGYIQIRSIQLQDFPYDWLSRNVVILGVLLFFIGLAINLHSDHTLRNLRKPGETSYKIPRGGMFEYVSAANYFGESIEWLGFFLAVQTTAAAAFCFFTVCNLWPRAFSHHRWYKEKFEDYPRDRKVILPFIL